MLARAGAAVDIDSLAVIGFMRTRALAPLLGNWAGAHRIGKISGVLIKIGKFDILLSYDISIARLIPIIKLGIFCLELEKKHTFWHWEWGRISAPKSSD